jgi:hypothetical protein
MRPSRHHDERESYRKTRRIFLQDPSTPVHVDLTPRAVQAYPASGTLPRLTLSPSPGRSDQNDSDDSMVSPPSVSKV